ncbi:MAG: hypothetical protein PVI26_13990 [Chitinispirillia bacterium]|jgi:hypothetical protein
MKKTLLIIVFTFCCISLSFGGSSFFKTESHKHENDTYNHPNQGYKPNRYGLGVHSDNYGRPFQWKTQQGETVRGFIKVDPHGYGPGISKDQFGRPVTRKPFGK